VVDQQHQRRPAEHPAQSPTRPGRRQRRMRELVHDHGPPALSAKHAGEPAPGRRIERPAATPHIHDPDRATPRSQAVNDPGVVQVAAGDLTQRAGHHPSDRIRHDIIFMAFMGTNHGTLRIPSSGSFQVRSGPGPARA
jgi:hypothetical protein